MLPKINIIWIGFKKNLNLYSGPFVLSLGSGIIRYSSFEVGFFWWCSDIGIDGKSLDSIRNISSKTPKEQHRKPGNR